MSEQDDNNFGGFLHFPHTWIVYIGVKGMEIRTDADCERGDFKVLTKWRREFP